jgi:hypothetical protein
VIFAIKLLLFMARRVTSKMMFTRCSTETRTIPLLLLKLLLKFYVSTTLTYFCTVDCRTKIIIKPQVLNCS